MICGGGGRLLLWVLLCMGGVWMEGCWEVSKISFPGESLGFLDVEYRDGMLGRDSDWEFERLGWKNGVAKMRFRNTC